MPTIIDALVFSYTVYTAVIFFPLVLGMFWKRGNATGAISRIAYSPQRPEQQGPEYSHGRSYESSKNVESRLYNIEYSWKAEKSYHAVS
jgi:hypothetical protein